MHPFDPSIEVTVADATPNFPPDILHFNLQDKDKTVRAVAPEFVNDVPTYKIPRHYAERILENAGGRTFVLIDPPFLMARVSNARGGMDLVKISAKKIMPNGQWISVENQVAEKPTLKSIAETYIKPVMDHPSDPSAPEVDSTPESDTSRLSKKAHGK